MRKTLLKLGEYLQGATVSNVVNFVLALIGTGLVVINLEVDIKWNSLFWIPTTIVIVGAVYIAFLIFAFFLNEAIHGLGKWLIKLSKWYPEWFYRPKFHYHLQTERNNTLTLYIKSSPQNKRAHLILEFHRAKLINARDEQKYSIDLAIGNVRNKILFDKEIAPNDKMIVTISGKSSDGRDMLCFPFDHFGIALFPGKYAYQLRESGTHKGGNFSNKPVTLYFVFTENGEFSV